jgi:hypothetical protein
MLFGHRAGRPAGADPPGLNPLQPRSAMHRRTVVAAAAVLDLPPPAAASSARRAGRERQRPLHATIPISVRPAAAAARAR